MGTKKFAGYCVSVDLDQERLKQLSKLSIVFNWEHGASLCSSCRVKNWGKYADATEILGRLTLASEEQTIPVDARRGASQSDELQAAHTGGLSFLRVAPFLEEQTSRFELGQLSSAPPGFLFLNRTTGSNVPKKRERKQSR